MGINNIETAVKENTEAGDSLTGMSNWVCFPESTEVVDGKPKASCFTNLTK